MSADRQRLVGAIRRIVKEDPDVRKVLDAYANRGDQAGAGAKAASQGEDEKICCDGSTAAANAGTSERDPDAESQDGLDADDPARITAGDGTLSGVTDCATGEDVIIEGSGFIPPDGWDSPTEPPEDPTYTEGLYWTATGDPLDYRAPTRAEAAALWLAERGGGMSGINCLGDFVAIDTRSTSPYDCFSGDSGKDASTIGGTFYQGDRTPFSQYSCTGVEGEPYCNPDPEDILASEWPSDGAVNLAIIDGTLVGSKYDPDQDGGYSTPKTSIELCDGASRILYQPLPGGGFRTIESSGGVAVTDAVGYTYSADGTLTGTITQAEWDATAP